MTSRSREPLSHPPSDVPAEVSPKHADPDGILLRSIERHYDSLALLYRAFWGEHIHHGYWSRTDLESRAAQEQLVAQLAARAGIREGECVLDVGCGYGASGRWLASSLGCHVTGVTISGKQARLARRYNKRRGLVTRTPVLRADAARLPLADAGFDVVWSIECLEHLRDKEEFVRRAAVLLRPGGRLAVCSWLRGDGISPDNSLIRDVCEAFLCPSLATAGDYLSWFAAAGLEHRAIEDLTEYVCPTWKVLAGRLRRMVAFRPLVSRGIRRFVDGFPKIYEAFGSGVMTYGLFVVRRPSAAG